MGCAASNPSLVNHTQSHQRLSLLFAYLFYSNRRNSLAEMCIGVMCTCMPSLSVTLRHHASQFATFRSSISSGFNYFSDLRSRSAPFTKPESLTPYPRKAKKVYSELEMSTSAYRGDRHRSLEESQQYDVESLGTKKSRAFVGEEDRIYLRQDVTVSRQ